MLPSTHTITLKFQNGKNLWFHLIPSLPLIRRTFQSEVTHLCPHSLISRTWHRAPLRLVLILPHTQIFLSSQEILICPFKNGIFFLLDLLHFEANNSKLPVYILAAKQSLFCIFMNFYYHPQQHGKVKYN